jgi:iron complex outermembrane recepter protein
MSAVRFQRRVIAVLIAGSWGAACATELPTGDVIPDVVVTATKSRQDVRNVPSSVTVIDRATIEKSNAQTVDQLLQGMPGVYAARMDISSPGRISQVYSRGLPGSGRTLVLVDGVPMNGLYDGQVEWAQLSTRDVERVEVVRGASSGLYGNNAMGGVINIISRAPKEGRETMIDAEGGSMNTKSLAATYSQRSGADAFSVSGRALDSDGYDMWTEASKAAAGANASHMIATGTEKRNLATRYFHDFGDQFSLDTGLNYSRDLTTGIYDTPDYTAQEREQYLASVRMRHFADKTESTFLLFGRFGTQQADTSNTTYTAVASTGDYDDRNVGVNWQTSTEMTDTQRLTFGADYSKGSIENNYRYVAEPTRINDLKGNMMRSAVFVQDEIRPDAGWVFNLAGRYDSWKTDGSLTDRVGMPQGDYATRRDGAFSPKAGVVYHVTNDVGVRASAGKAFNLPDMTQLYAATRRGTTTYWGNPELRPETIVSLDTGVDWYWGKAGFLKATIYRNTAKDFIYSVRRDATNFDKVNVGGVRTHGVELESSYRGSDSLTLRASYTYNNSIIREYEPNPALVGMRLTNVPDHQASVRADMTFTPSTTVYVTGNYVGKRYGSDDNTTAYGSYSTYDLGMSQQFGANVSGRLTVTNVGDRVYAGIGYMAPGRVVSAGITAKF